MYEFISGLFSILIKLLPVQITCGAQINQEVAYFENPNYPMPFSEVLDCSGTISLMPNVEQILLEFIKLELRPPLNGDCNEDRLLISGQSINHIVPIICGINNGQHSKDIIDQNRKIY